MICTFTPLFLFPADSFKYAPYGLSLFGQYIIKNIIIISSGWVIWQEQKLKKKKLPVTGQRPALFVFDQHSTGSLQKTM
jgi:hypothetical protein